MPWRVAAKLSNGAAPCQLGASRHDGMFRPAPHFDGLPTSRDGLLRTDRRSELLVNRGGFEWPCGLGCVPRGGDLPTSENSQSALFKPRSEYHRADRLDDPLTNCEGGGLPNCLLLAAPYRVPARMNHAACDEAPCRVDRALQATTLWVSS